MATADEQVIVDGQRAVAVSVQNGDYIYDGGTTDIQCVVNNNGTAQRAIKVTLVGPGGAAKPKYVSELPETGEEGVLYLVPSGETRDGYAIFQMFSWHEGDWVAIGAFDVGIDPTGLLYQKSWDASTNTLVVTTDGSNNSGSGVDLSDLPGYDANAPLQRIANLNGVQTWQTRSVFYKGFGGSGYKVTTPSALPDSVSSVDLIVECTAPSADSSSAQDFIVRSAPSGQSISWEASSGSSGRLQFWDGSQATYYNLSFTNILGQTIWLRVKGGGTYNLYYLNDNSRTYTPETLPDLSSWTNLGTINLGCNSAILGAGTNSSHYIDDAFTLYNFIIYANGDKVFDMRANDFVLSTGAIAKNEQWN